MKNVLSVILFPIVLGLITGCSLQDNPDKINRNSTMVSTVNHHKCKGKICKYGKFGKLGIEKSTEDTVK